ncbi:outer membrane protein TolC [Edaphobacter modestus]|uniref:Outer membrane protein TolC n=2 Tax=Edaphobacter modestus TaxID=388466 RepID=A0A4Q7YRM1_9BACT|nr:TolC family protein [Edaphobacter modestus]RZU39563.1 outer membrane protein TolC [Edaphobacter modestus]
MQAAACIGLLLMSVITQPLVAQQTNVQPQTNPQPQTQTSPTAPAPEQPVVTDTTGTPGLPQAPLPKPTEPFFLRDTEVDYTKPKSHLWNPIAPYTATNVPQARLGNTPQLDQLVRDGKIYLSLNDAVTLALQNNYDIEIARINLDIADTDILRTKAGGTIRGVNTGLVQGTIGGTTQTVTGGGGPGGTSTAVGGGAAGATGIVLSTNGGGPLPINLDPVLTGQLQYEAANTQQTTTFITGTDTLQQNTGTYNFGYQQGFISGTTFNFTFNNSRSTTNSIRSNYSPQLNSLFQARVTQNLLQGFGPGLNGRLMLQARNDRRITDSAFRQQLLFTVTQVEDIYWGLVSAYEDEQAKERALAQSTQLTADNRRQLEIGTLAPLDVVNSDAAVASDKQLLVASQTNLEYQQLLMKQAIARNLNDPQLSNAPVIPTDRISLDRLPEEDTPIEDLVRQAYANNPQIEQAALNMKNNEITIKAFKNNLLPTVNAYAFYGGSALGGQQNPVVTCSDPNTGLPIPCNIPQSGYSDVLGNTFNGKYPDKGAGVNINIPLRNRIAQADQARSQMEYRQSEMRLQQLYTQTRINVINGQYALTNDRAQVQAAQASRDFAVQSLDAEQKKYKLGASTTALVLQQQRNLAIAANNLISATAVYAKDRVALGQLLSTLLDKYGINIVDAATGNITHPLAIPGLTAPKPQETPQPLSTAPAAPPQ